MTEIAIIGAGLSGLTAANILKKYCPVTLFEKSRGVGGRMSMRKEGPYSFDHGAQFFKAKNDRFKLFIAPMIENHVIEPWNGRFVEIQNREIITTLQGSGENTNYVGVPAMNAMANYLKNDLNIKLRTKIISISKNSGKWLLKDDKGNVSGDYDWVIFAVPPKQVLDIMPSSFSSYFKIASVKMNGCISMMLGFKKALHLEFDGAFVHDEDIRWISVNSSKPKRGNDFCMVVHSTNQWARDNMGAQPHRSINSLCYKTSHIIGYDVSNAEHKDLHLWRYANIEKQRGETSLIDLFQKLGVCGDWLIQSQVESAFISGFDLANKIVRVWEDD